MIKNRNIRDAEEQLQFSHCSVVSSQCFDIGGGRQRFGVGELAFRGEFLDIGGSRCQIFASVEVGQAKGIW